MANGNIVNGANYGVLVDTACNTADNCDAKMKVDLFSDIWRFDVEDLYKIAVVFFKEKVGSKALQVGYKDKLRMVALTKQVSQGPYNASTMPAVGLFDVVGNDRRLAWQSLGNMSREDAIKDFISFLRTNCPLFTPYIQAKFAEREEQEGKKKEQEEEERRSRQEIERLNVDAATLQEEDKKRQLSQEMIIRAALNQQTAVQFQQYAEQQFPGNKSQQEVLVRQLQDQHYIQYMQQFYSQQLVQQQLHQQQQNGVDASVPLQTSSQQLQQSPHHPTQQTESVCLSPTQAGVQPQQSQMTSTSGVLFSKFAQRRVDGGADQSFNVQKETSVSASPKQMANGLQNASKVSGNHIEDDPDSNDLPPIAAASMWTRKEIKDFKDSVKSDPESVIQVGSGEIVTVRVPTHEDGSCLFWEFATDSYDVGFGVYFEWTVEPSNQMSIVTESSEDEEDEHGHNANNDPDSTAKSEPEVPTEEIVPPFRRDCHEEVYCGSHVYPGRGVYLLKFDNSYSLWRGKTLYYRVYYTR